MTTRPIRDPGLVRLGVRGSLSATYSATAASERIATATLDPMNARGDPCRSSQPRQAAQLTAAGAVRERKPATIPLPIALIIENKTDPGSRRLPCNRVARDELSP